MNSKLFLLSLLFVSLFLRSSSNEDCDKKTILTAFGYVLKYACGTGCTGTPSCGDKTCGHVADMCYCDCEDGKDEADCKTTELGYKWNHGALMANGSYALNGTKGDGGGYKC